MWDYKIKCVVCGKKTAKYVYKVDGEYFDKPVCRKCCQDLLMQYKDFNDKVEEHNKKLQFRINTMLAFSVLALLLGIIWYCMAEHDSTAVLSIFREQSKLIYFLLFAVLNNVTGYMTACMSHDLPKWLRIIFNFIFTIELTLLGCVVAISDKINFISVRNPYMYVIPFMIVVYGTVIFLNHKKSIDKSKLIIVAIVVIFISCGSFLFGLLCSP